MKSWIALYFDFEHLSAPFRKLAVIVLQNRPRPFNIGEENIRLMRHNSVTTSIHSNMVICCHPLPGFGAFVGLDLDQSRFVVGGAGTLVNLWSLQHERGKFELPDPDVGKFPLLSKCAGEIFIRDLTLLVLTEIIVKPYNLEGCSRMSERTPIATRSWNSYFGIVLRA